MTDNNISNNITVSRSTAIQDDDEGGDDDNANNDNSNNNTSAVAERFSNSDDIQNMLNKNKNAASTSSTTSPSLTTKKKNRYSCPIDDNNNTTSSTTITTTTTIDDFVVSYHYDIITPSGTNVTEASRYLQDGVLSVLAELFLPCDDYDDDEGTISTRKKRRRVRRRRLAMTSSDDNDDDNVVIVGLSSDPEDIIDETRLCSDNHDANKTTVDCAPMIGYLTVTTVTTATTTSSTATTTTTHHSSQDILQAIKIAMSYNNYHTSSSSSPLIDEVYFINEHDPSQMNVNNPLLDSSTENGSVQNEDVTIYKSLFVGLIATTVVSLFFLMTLVGHLGYMKWKRRTKTKRERKGGAVAAVVAEDDGVETQDKAAKVTSDNIIEIGGGVGEDRASLTDTSHLTDDTEESSGSNSYDDDGKKEGSPSRRTSERLSRDDNDRSKGHDSDCSPSLPSYEDEFIISPITLNRNNSENDQEEKDETTTNSSPTMEEQQRQQQHRRWGMRDEEGFEVSLTSIV